MRFTLLIACTLLICSCAKKRFDSIITPNESKLLSEKQGQQTFDLTELEQMNLEVSKLQGVKRDQQFWSELKSINQRLTELEKKFNLFIEQEERQHLLESENQEEEAHEEDSSHSQYYRQLRFLRDKVNVLSVTDEEYLINKSKDTAYYKFVEDYPKRVPKLLSITSSQTSDQQVKVQIPSFLKSDRTQKFTTIYLCQMNDLEMDCEEQPSEN